MNFHRTIIRLTVAGISKLSYNRDMTILDRLEDRFGRYTIPNLTYFLIGGQALAFIITQFYPDYGQIFVLRGDLLTHGDWWRAVTFLFMPLSTDFIFAVFTWYLYYLYGTALERLWGTFRYTVYLLIAYAATIGLAFLFPYTRLTNTYIYASLFLAFAYRFPDFELLLFFIIPVKVKWLAVLAWIGLLGTLLFGAIPTKIQTVVSVLNFLLFFGEELWMTARHRFHRVSYSVKYKADHAKAYHICAVCGDNEVDNPDMEIRYCSSCVPSTCYCGKHIKNHTHRRPVN